MGWITFNKSKHISPSDYFRDTFKGEPNHELLDIAIVKRRTAYMAVRLKETGQVIAFVYLLHYGRGWDNFGYKDMTEFSGPSVSECPKRILSLLTPLDDEKDPNGWARDWRKRCMDIIENKASKKKVKVGDVIKLTEELTFNSGLKHDFFRKTERTNVWVVTYQIGSEFRDSYNKVRFQANKFDYEVISEGVPS
jgi:hypothetical protein